MARISFERRDFGEDMRRWLSWLDGESTGPQVAGEFMPAMDVLETTSAVEVVVDVPGVRADALRVVLAGGVLVVAGTKLASQCPHHEAAFHLAERAFGRFARVVRLAGALDAGRGTATIRAGELRIVLPRIEERRGREIRIPLQSEQ